VEIVETNMDKFMWKNKVWDRKELLHRLDDIARKRGNFACLLGGKSTGKSLVLGELSRNNMMNRKVIYIDMREYSGITQGLVDVLSKSNIVQFQNLSKEFVKNVLAIAKLKVSDLVEIDVRALLDILLKDSDPNTALKTLIGDIVRGCPNECITLVLDEANLPLTISNDTPISDIMQVGATLSLFTTLTKQQKKVNYQILLLISSPVIIALQYYLLYINVILVSSEHVFPFRLADPKLGFNLEDITEFLFAGEVPPNEMYKLLTEEWKLSETLSLALISLDTFGIYTKD